MPVTLYLIYNFYTNKVSDGSVYIMIVILMQCSCLHAIDKTVYSNHIITASVHFLQDCKDLGASPTKHVKKDISVSPPLNW